MRLYKTALGIATGDILHIEKRVCPYLVMTISPPRYVNRDRMHGIFVRDYPTIYLSGRYLTDSESLKNNTWYLSDVRNHPEQGYLSGRTPFTIEKSDQYRKGFQVDMFESYLDSLIDEPYQFQEGVDYLTADPWHCYDCNLDFNAPPLDWNKYNTYCPKCERMTNKHVFVMNKTTANEFIVGINHGTKVTYGN